MKWQIKAEHHGKLIREFLMGTVGFSKRLLIKAKTSGGAIMVNGESKTVRYQLEQGDLLTVKLPPEEIAERMKRENLPLEIVYEDDFLLVINKPAGIATIPSKNHPSGTIANRLLYYYFIKNIPYTVHIVTRLDKDTSGLVLIAKNQYSHSRLASLQKAMGIRRKYHAIVHGRLKENTGKIHQPIGRMEDSIIKRMVTSEGKQAITNYRTIEKGESYSFLEIELETGRTHQIRVHMAFLGHPILGDDLYGGTRELIVRQALHCSELSFYHPFTNRLVTFTAAMPADMQTIIPSLPRFIGN